MTKKTGRDTLASQEKPVSTSFTTKIAKLWWLFPLATIIFAALALLTVDGHFAMCLIFCGLSAITLVLQIPVFVILLVKKRWWIAVASFFLTIVSLILFIALPALFVIMYYFGSNFESIEDTDPFGQKHTIPEGMEYNIPLACTTNDGDTIDDGDNEFLGCVKVKPIIDSTDTTSWLQIWQGAQGGMYEYTLHWPSLKDGVVYLQCFEATQNVKLSSDMVKSNTEIQVSGHNRFGQIGICQKTDKSQALSVDPTHARKFTIYEGDWGDYYAVRVEVWHNPTHGRNHKLMDKTYRMEGWMR